MGRKLTQEEVSIRIETFYKENVILISEYRNKRSKIKLRCLDCDYEWTTTAQNILYRDNPIANRRCPNCGDSNELRKNGQYFTCSYCGKTLYRSQSDIDKNKTGLWYCSRECGNLHKNKLREESGEWKESQNYRRRAFEIYRHECLICGWDEDERILEVHHLDSDRTHNEIENLSILCPTCHRKITLGYYQLQGDMLIPL